MPRVVSVLVLAVAIADGGGAQQLEKLLAADGDVNDALGSAIAADGQRCVVAARKSDVAGAAYVFELGAAGWAQTAKLVPSDGVAAGTFGRSLAIDGDRVLVGANNQFPETTETAGAVYVFERAGAAWTQTAKLTASDAAEGDYFGVSVALEGDVAVVGAGWNDDPSENAGSVYVFERQGTAWVETAELAPLDAAASTGAFFGCSVAIAGSRILAGAYGNDSPTLNCGAAYVFELGESGWAQVAKLTAADADVADWFGLAVALSPDGEALVGAPNDDQLGENAGAAYVFRAASGWAQTAKLVAADGGASDLFGFAADLDGDAIFVGADRDQGTVGLGAGSAYVFARVGSAWVETAKIQPADAAPGDFFGRAVAVSGAVALAGSIGADDSGSESGAAYALDLCGLVPGLERAILSASGGPISLVAGGAQQLVLETCPPSFAGAIYLVAGSTAAAPPGQGIPIDGILLPLTVDAYGLWALANANGPILPGFLGLFDANSSATATLAVPPAAPPALAGLTLYHAFVAFAATPPFEALLASNAVSVQLVP